MKKLKIYSSKKLLAYFLPTIFTLIISIIFILYNGNSANVSDSNNNNTYEVISVTDGDTITVKNTEGTEYKVRYLYVDTPESVKPGTAVQCFAKSASEFNKELVHGKKVKLEKDVEDTDVYDRLLRYVYVDTNNDGNFSQDEMVNLILVQKGFAKIYIPPKGYDQPNTRYKEILDKAQETAKQDQVGLWKECDANQNISVTVTPELSSSPNSHTACDIKGNISSDGEKVYHMPGQRYYDKTVIEPDKGERLFCTEADATAAGFRKSKV